MDWLPMIDYHAELQALVTAIEDDVIDTNDGIRFQEAVDRARAVLARWGRAALAEPEPEGPTVMEIIELADEIEAAELGQVDLVRAALTRWGRAALAPAEGEVGKVVDALRADAECAEVEVVGPSDEELLARLDKATSDFPPLHPEAESLNAFEYALALELRKARAVLASFGRPAPEPVADGEAGELVAKLRRRVAQNPLGIADPAIARADDLLERQHPLPQRSTAQPH